MMIEIQSGEKLFAFDTFQIAYMDLDETLQILVIHTHAGEVKFGRTPTSRAAAFSSKVTNPLSLTESRDVYLLWREWLLRQDA